MEASELKVMTFNVRYDNPRDGDHSWDARKEAVIRLVKDENPDAFGIQEGLIHQVNYIKENFRDYHLVGAGRDDGREAGEHVAIFCRESSFQIEASGTFWLSDTPRVPGSNTWHTSCRRICTWVLAGLAYGTRTVHVEQARTPVLLMNTHLDNASLKAREKGASLIIDQMHELYPSGPCILMGDLNTRRINEKTARIIIQGKAGTKLTMAGRSSTGSNRKGNAGFTWHDFRGLDATRFHPRGFYDYIFYTSAFREVGHEIITRKVGGIYPSDHFPVVARLTWR